MLILFRCIIRKSYLFFTFFKVFSNVFYINIRLKNEDRVFLPGEWRMHRGGGEMERVIPLVNLNLIDIWIDIYKIDNENSWALFSVRAILNDPTCIHAGFFTAFFSNPVHVWLVSFSPHYSCTSSPPGFRKSPDQIKQSINLRKTFRTFYAHSSTIGIYSC